MVERSPTNVMDTDAFHSEDGLHQKSATYSENDQFAQEDVSPTQTVDVLRHSLREELSDLDLEKKTEGVISQTQAPLSPGLQVIHIGDVDETAPKSLISEKATGRPHATVPKPFHFHSMRKKSADIQTAHEDVALAQSADELRHTPPEESTTLDGEKRTRSITKPEAPPFRKGLRGMDEAVSPTSAGQGANKYELTRPESPKFHQIRSKELPKSSEEKEQEMMDHFKAHPFKARNAPKNPLSPDDESSQCSSNQSVTEPKPFRFRSDERAAQGRRIIEKSVDKEAMDLKECKKQFRARPMPEMPAPPLSPARNVRKNEPVKLEEQESPKFHARPAPKTTYTSPVRLKPKVEPPPVVHTSPPDLMTESRATHREAAAEAFRRRADEVNEEKQKTFMARLRQKHEEMMRDACKHNPVPEVKPFELKSELRHEAYQNMLAERRQQEEEEQRCMTQFHARPLPPNSPPKSPTATLAVRRNLEYTLRVTTEKQDSSPEDSSPEMSFKARPLPKTTYAKPVSPARKSGSKSQCKNPTKSRESNGADEDTRQPGLATQLEHTSSLGPKESTQSDINNQATEISPTDHVDEVATASLPPFSWPLFFLVCAFRVLNTFLVQSYFDPDEFWQTMEPAYCEAFVTDRPCPGFTWEWKRRPPSSTGNFIEQSMWGPARSYVSVLPTYAFFLLAKRFGIDSHWLVARGPMILSSLIVAAPVDMAVWYAARWLPDPRGNVQRRVLPAWCLFCSLVSWFNGYSLVRTFANSQETLFLIVAIALMAPELLGNEKSKWEFLRSCASFLLGGLSVSIRFTSLAAFVPMGILLALRRKSVLGRLFFLIVPCAVFGLIGLAIAMVIDYKFFGFWTLPFLGNFHFNVVLDNADLYGSHPFQWYFTTGLPVISGMLLPFLLWDIVDVLSGRTKASYGQRNLWIIVVSYLFIMSFNGHKEFRYIHPVLPLICLLTGRHVHALFVGRARRTLRFVCLAAASELNLLAVMYLGLFHQSGPIEVNHQIVAASEQQHVVNPDITSYSVHYLTGACHSTPLHSHLHAPPLTFETWALDCSPGCRTDPDAICEAERFANDPAGFVIGSYFSSSDDSEDGIGACSSTATRCHVPDFVVTFSRYSQLIQPHLETLGLYEHARYPHHVNGAKIGSLLIGQEFGKESFRSFSVIEGLDLSLEEIVLFSRHH